MPNRDRETVAEIKRALSDPKRVLETLGLLGEGRAKQKQAGGFIVRCPVHEDRTPSCSVQQKAGVLLWNCHGCGASGDVLSLVAVARGLSLRRAFRDVLLESARLGGLWDIVARLESGTRDEQELGNAQRRAATVPPTHDPVPERPRTYPEGADAFWGKCVPATEDAEVVAYLQGRAIDPDRVDSGDLARVLPRRGPLPAWAMCRFGDWRTAGYRLIVPMRDAKGDLRSVRAWRVTDGEGPKRLPPSGHRANALVMADEFGRAMLRESITPERVVILEGEPDFLTWATRVCDPHCAVLGIVSGSWCDELASRIPIGSRVIVRTDHDEAGERYFREIQVSLQRRAFVGREREAV